MQKRVYLGVGSNLADRHQNCLKAIELLKKSEIKITKISSIYETQPWGVKEQPNFLNLVLEAQTRLSPAELLYQLKTIEKNIGRKESFRWGPRKIDIDILFYGSLTLLEHDLRIPHPYIQERDFVLKPMAEIAPMFVHPLFRKTIYELLQEFLKCKKIQD